MKLLTSLLAIMWLTSFTPSLGAYSSDKDKRDTDRSKGKKSKYYQVVDYVLQHVEPLCIKPDDCFTKATEILQQCNSLHNEFSHQGIHHSKDLPKKINDLSGKSPELIGWWCIVESRIFDQLTHKTGNTVSYQKMMSELQEMAQVKGMKSPKFATPSGGLCKSDEETSPVGSCGLPDPRDDYLESPMASDSPELGLEINPDCLKLDPLLVSGGGLSADPERIPPYDPENTPPQTPEPQPSTPTPPSTPADPKPADSSPKPPPSPTPSVQVTTRPGGASVEWDCGGVRCVAGGSGNSSGGSGFIGAKVGGIGVGHMGGSSTDGKVWAGIGIFGHWMPSPESDVNLMNSCYGGVVAGLASCAATGTGNFPNTDGLSCQFGEQAKVMNPDPNSPPTVCSCQEGGNKNNNSNDSKTITNLETMLNGQPNQAASSGGPCCPQKCFVAESSGSIDCQNCSGTCSGIGSPDHDDSLMAFCKEGALGMKTYSASLCGAFDPSPLMQQAQRGYKK